MFANHTVYTALLTVCSSRFNLFPKNVHVFQLQCIKALKHRFFLEFQSYAYIMFKPYSPEASYRWALLPVGNQASLLPLCNLT